MLRLAGVRINPRTNAERSYIYYYTGLTLKGSPTVPSSRSRFPPPSAAWALPMERDGIDAGFSPTKPRMELSFGSSMRPLKKSARSPASILIRSLGPRSSGCRIQKTLLVKAIPTDRGAPPAPPVVPPGPKIQESLGVSAASSTYEAATSEKPL